MFKNTKIYFSRIVLLLCVCLAGASCERKNTVREYEEVVLPAPLDQRKGMLDDPHAFMNDPSFMGFDHPDISGSMPMGMGTTDPQMQQALNASIASVPLSWSTPKGWSEEKGNAMRLVTFRAEGDGSGIECSIVSLGGQAGGYVSNVTRWMNQVKLEVPSGKELDQFIERQQDVKTAGGFSVKVFDFTTLAAGEDSRPSMVAGIADLNDKTIFVKMTGTQQALLANKEKFLGLVKSLNLN